MMKNFKEAVVNEMRDFKEYFEDEFKNPDLIQRTLFIMMVIVSVLMIVFCVTAIVMIIMRPELAETEEVKETMDNLERLYHYRLMKNCLMR
jgi:hypothetical protein